MQKRTLKWEPSSEKMFVRDGVLKGDVNESVARRRRPLSM